MRLIDSDKLIDRFANRIEWYTEKLYEENCSENSRSFIEGCIAATKDAISLIKTEEFFEHFNRLIGELQDEDCPYCGAKMDGETDATN